MWDSIRTETSSSIWVSTNCSDPREQFSAMPGQKPSPLSNKRQKKNEQHPSPSDRLPGTPPRRTPPAAGIPPAGHLPARGDTTPSARDRGKPRTEALFQGFRPPPRRPRPGGGRRGRSHWPHLVPTDARFRVCGRTNAFAGPLPAGRNRGKGIGTQLLENMLQLLRGKGYAQVSLSVQKATPAFRLYKRLGFEKLRETDEEYILVRKL